MRRKKKLFAILLSTCCFIILLGGCTSHSTHHTKNSIRHSAIYQTKPYDYAILCNQYLTELGTNDINRDLENISEEGNTHDKAQNYIVSELKKAGYVDSRINLQKFKKDGYQGTNIVVNINGKSSKKEIICGAHYDGDGCGDNSSGVALLLGNAVGMIHMTPKYDVVLIFFDGEELGELGSNAYLNSMSKQEIKATEYMINIDSVAFGDYCNLYGGESNVFGKVTKTKAYTLSMQKAAAFGMSTYTTADLDGYYKTHNKTGPTIEENAIYTNPWTKSNPSPKNFNYISPSTGDWGDHAPFADAHINYVYMEATNWYAKGDNGSNAYTGYFDTNETQLGDHGMFMNTKYDTLNNLNSYFPGRALAHFHIFSPLLTSLLMNPDGVAPQ